MATETAASDHSASSEKEVHEAVNTTEEERVSPPQGSGEEEKPKAGDSPSPAVPLAESEKKIEDKQIEPSDIVEVKKTDEGAKPKTEDTSSPAVPSAELEGKIDKPTEPSVTEQVRKTDEEEKPKAEYSPSPAVPSAELEEQIEDKQTEAPIIEVERKTDGIPTSDTAVKDIPEIANVPEPKVDDKSQPEEQSVVDIVEKQSQEESKAEIFEEKPVEQPKIVDHPKTSVEFVEKKQEQLEELPVKEPETVATKDVENIEAETKKDSILESVVEVDEKPQEQYEVIEHVVKESVAVEPKKTEEVEMVKDKEISAENIQEANLSKEEQVTKEEHLVTQSSDQVTSINQETLVAPKGDEVNSPPATVTGNTGMEDKEELSGEADGVERVPKEEVVELGKVEKENEPKNVKPEKNEGKNAVPKESTQPETKKLEDVSSSVQTTEATEKSLEGENTARDVELVAESGKDSIKDEHVASVETNQGKEIEDKVDEVTTTSIKEPVEEPQKTEMEEKAKETVLTGESNLEKEKEVDETAEPDVTNPEFTKDTGETATSQDPTKEEVSVKSTHKQSNNILAKVKQSIVKAKKAITGKSANSKTPSSETKDDGKS